jgi:hypothetical protein
MGVTGVRRDLVHDRFINYLPFIALMVITPGLSRRRRWIGGLIGCFVLYLGHVGLTYASFLAFVQHGQSPESMQNLFPAYIVSDAMPLLLWAVIANEWLRDVGSQYFGAGAAVERPHRAGDVSSPAGPAGAGDSSVESASEEDPKLD